MQKNVFMYDPSGHIRFYVSIVTIGISEITKTYRTRILHTRMYTTLTTYPRSSGEYQMTSSADEDSSVLRHQARM